MDKLRSSRPGHGPEWDAAVEFGIDVSLIESNAELTPAERIQDLVATAEERDRLTAMELQEEIARLGPELMMTTNVVDSHAPLASQATDR